MEPVQSRIRQRSRVLAPALSSLVMAVFLGATACFLIALPAGLALDTDLLVEAHLGAVAFFAMTFLAGAFFAFTVDEERVVLAFGILFGFLFGL